MKTLSSIILAGSILATQLPMTAMAGQPHMVNALNALRGARASLEHAVSDKGGHRLRAIALIDDAINQLKIGMAAAR